MGSVTPARVSFSLARLNLIRQSCVVLRETFVQLGKSFRGGATTTLYIGMHMFYAEMKFLGLRDCERKLLQIIQCDHICRKSSKRRQDISDK